MNNKEISTYNDNDSYMPFLYINQEMFVNLKY